MQLSREIMRGNIQFQRQRHGVRVHCDFRSTKFVLILVLLRQTVIGLFRKRLKTRFLVRMSVFADKADDSVLHLRSVVIPIDAL